MLPTTKKTNEASPKEKRKTSSSKDLPPKGSAAYKQLVLTGVIKEK
tara:strand:- start:197 stop:334 length:138 start_codon:yes stop_codon:yes gene_type:complete